jgi:choline dehydrogenase
MTLGTSLDWGFMTDANGAMMEGGGGAALVDELVRDGKRHSIFQSYVVPIASTDTLSIMIDTEVLKILFERQRAVGVVLERDGKVFEARARREIVLSAGAINMPRILLQSGIGNPEALKSLGIDVVQSLPAVGENLHDHIAFGLIWEKTLEPMPFAPRSESASFWKTDSSLDAPNMYTYAVQGAFASPEILKTSVIPEQTWSMFVEMRPRSRGRVYLRAADDKAPVGIDSGHLRNSKDLEDLRTGLQVSRDIGRGAALKA